MGTAGSPSRSSGSWSVRAGPHYPCPAGPAAGLRPHATQEEAVRHHGAAEVHAPEDGTDFQVAQLGPGAGGTARGWQ